MKALLRWGSPLLLIAALGGCQTMEEEEAGGTRVTRFHLGQPVATGQIAVEAFDQADANDPEFQSFAGAVEAELTRLGYTVVRTLGQSEQIALIDVEQGSPQAIAARPGMNIGGSRRQADTTAAADSVSTLLEVSIKRRSDGTVFWEGRAARDAAAGSAEAGRSAVIAQLARALFQDFPGESGRTISAR